jgi:tetraacyldisaccharide 4'-kinase
MNLNPALRALLRPLSILYGGVARLRTGLYRHGIFHRKSLPQVVVSVGNLSVGGTGKTPMVLWITERLLAEGKRVAILTRGYRSRGDRKVSGKSWVSDEVQLLARRTAGLARVLAGANRYREASRMEHKDVDWFVLDDGFQHLRLARDVDIVLVDGLNPFAGGVLPAGCLREPLSALARADIVVITRSAGAPAIEEQLRRHTPAPIFYAQTELEAILPIPRASRASTPLPAPGNIRFFSFCGIGNPEGFRVDLSERWRFQLVGATAFRDHHAYSASDLRKIERGAQAAGAEALVCTEKDVYNLPADKFDMLPAYFCRIGLQVNDPDGFWRTILASVERRRAGGAR